MSKLSQLKQDAYQAGKKRNWDEAVALYERILEVDKNNPTVINELGDLCLKAGKTPQAVRHFLSAASKYRQTGLLNNAVAIYKKILRYEAANLNAHWYLAETRSSQGLLVEGEIHALQFLEGSEKVAGEIKEIFLKRCVQVLEIYPESEAILEKLVQIFRTWDMKLESSRAALLHAGTVCDAGREDEAQSIAESALASVPEVRNYPEFARWQKKTDPGASPGAPAGGFGQVELDETSSPAAEPAAESAPEPVVEPVAEPVAEPAVEPPAAAAPAPVPDTPAPADPAPAPVAAEAAPVDADPDGCITIDTEQDADFAELIAAATDAKPAPAPAAEPAPPPAETPVADDGPAGGQNVDLLAEILADDENLLAGGESSQLAAITREIGAQVGGDGSDQDPESLYNTGTVYLEMGMNDEAGEAFAQVVNSGDPDFCLRAREMWGEALQRAGRHDEAVEIMRDGLGQTSPDDPAYLGLLYNIGKSCEAAERKDEAVAAYEKIRSIDPGYLDVEQRLGELASV